MLNINLTNRSSTTVIGLLMYFVPFFTYLSPENLKQLSGSDVLEIFLSLIVLLIVIFIISFSVEMLMKRFFKKKIILFPLLCFAFYLNFLYIPFFEPLQEFIFITFDFRAPIGIPVFIFFELCCLAIIVIGAKFNVFSIRMILIFSILMLIHSFIPLVGYLAENIGKKPTITHEINIGPLGQDDVLIKRNIYYIIMDAMMAIETVEPFNVATKKELIDNLSNTELKYIDKSQSSYAETGYTIKALMLLDYHKKPSSPEYSDLSSVFPHMMYNANNDIPLLSYLEKANSSFIWMPGKDMDCIPTIRWTCVNSANGPSSNLWNLSINLWNFSLTTPLPKILQRFFNDIRSMDTIGAFIEYIDKNGLPKTPFLVYIHHYMPHGPHLVTSECEPTNNYFNMMNIESYKASYQCAVKTIQILMEKINNLDPKAIVIFQGDHGIRSELNIELTDKESDLFSGSIFNAIKAPEICFEKYGLPKTTVNTIRFALNCAYGFKLPYRKNIFYESKDWPKVLHGIVVERKLYE